MQIVQKRLAGFDLRFFFFFIFILKVDCRFPQGVRKDFSVLKSPIFYRLLTKKQLVGASVGA